MTSNASPRSVRGLVGVLGAQAASLSANRLLIIAVPWFVLTTTGSVAETGLVAFCQITPFVLAQALSGPLIDQIGARRVSIVGDLVSMTAIGTAALLYAFDALPVSALAALLAVVGAADGPATAAKSVFVPSVTRAARQSLERGTGLTTAVERTATVVGPALAGVIVAAYGGARALWLAATLLGLAAVVACTTLTDPGPEPHQPGHAGQSDEPGEPGEPGQTGHAGQSDEPGQPSQTGQTVQTGQTGQTGAANGYLARLREGATFLRQERLLRAIVGMLIATNLLDQAFIAVLLPVWARESGYGAATVGVVVSIFGATSILAALAAAAVGDRLPRRPVYLIGFIIGGVPRFAAMALGLPLWAVLSVFAVGGLGSGFINPIIGAVTYERIPAALLGRVRTLTSALAWSGIPFGGLAGAAMIGVSGATGALWIAGAGYLASIVIPGLRPEWSQMHRPALARPTGPTGPTEPTGPTGQVMATGGPSRSTPSAKFPR